MLLQKYMTLVDEYLLYLVEEIERYTVSEIFDKEIEVLDKIWFR